MTISRDPYLTEEDIIETTRTQTLVQLRSGETGFLRDFAIGNKIFFHSLERGYDYEISASDVARISGRGSLAITPISAQQPQQPTPTEQKIGASLLPEYRNLPPEEVLKKQSILPVEPLFSTEKSATGVGYVGEKGEPLIPIASTKEGQILIPLQEMERIDLELQKQEASKFVSTKYGEGVSSSAEATEKRTRELWEIEKTARAQDRPFEVIGATAGIFAIQTTYTITSPIETLFTRPQAFIEPESWNPVNVVSYVQEGYEEGGLIAASGRVFGIYLSSGMISKTLHPVTKPFTQSVLKPLTEPITAPINKGISTIKESVESRFFTEKIATERINLGETYQSSLKGSKTFGIEQKSIHISWKDRNQTNF